MLGQAMTPGLERHRVANDLLNPRLRGAGPQLRAQIDLVIAQQAQVQSAIGGQAHAITCRTKWIADRANEAELTLGTRDAKAAGRISRRQAKWLKRAMNGLQLSD